MTTHNDTKNGIALDFLYNTQMHFTPIELKPISYLQLKKK